MGWDSIREKIKSIKCFELKVVFLIVLFLWGAISFYLGKLAQLQNAPVEIEAEVSCPQRVEARGAVYGSWTGKVYYAPWCRSSVKYKRWFSSEQEAQSFGYRPAKNCKGLGL